MVRAAEMVAEGAVLVDVGGESTRPGAAPWTEKNPAWRLLWRPSPADCRGVDFRGHLQSRGRLAMPGGWRPFDQRRKPPCGIPDMPGVLRAITAHRSS